MNNPLRGFFKLTPEDIAALDAVREAMKCVNQSAFHLGDKERPINDQYWIEGRRYLMYFSWPGAEHISLTVSDRGEISYRPLRQLPLSHSGRRELRRMVAAFRVRLAMKRVKLTQAHDHSQEC